MGDHLLDLLIEGAGPAGLATGGRTEFVISGTRRTGEATTRRARAVVLATGYDDHPNRLVIPGEDLPHVSHYYSEPHPYYRKRVVVVSGRDAAPVFIENGRVHGEKIVRTLKERL